MLDLAAPPSTVAEVLRAGKVEIFFQPIVTLPGGRTVAFEALCRGPRGALERPSALFAAARSEGLLAEFDFACQEQALRTALEAGLSRPFTLFLNVEPAVTNRMPERLRQLYRQALERLDVAIEVTERSLTDNPSELLARVADLRRLGCRIALDDVGAHDRSLAMMSFLRPDVIKLDMGLIRRRPDRAVATVIHAAGAEAERTGTSILVEGVEEHAHARLGISMGATLAQGWYFGRPEPLTYVPVEPGVALALSPTVEHVPPRTPFAVAAHLPATRVSTKPLLYAMSRHLERRAIELGSSCVLISSFQTSRHMTYATRRRYGRIAERDVFCAALATGMEPEPAPGVRGAALDPADPLVREWNVAVISPDFAAALIAQDLGDAGPEDDRRFRYVVTYDRCMAVDAARSMMARLTGTPTA